MGMLDALKRWVKGSDDSGEAGEVPAPEDFEKPTARHITAEEFEILKQNGVLVVDFWAEWCGPCHILAPTIDRLAENFEGRAVIAKLNVDDHPQVASSLGILGIPTVIIFKDGQEVKRFLGVQSYDKLAQAVEKALGTG